MRLHYMPGAGSMVPHAALAEAGADYELVLVEEDDAGHRPESYRLVNPFGLVPNLEEGDLVLTETLAITLHIADRYPDSGLAPNRDASTLRALSMARVLREHGSAHLSPQIPPRAVHLIGDPRGGGDRCRRGSPTAHPPRLDRRPTHGPHLARRRNRHLRRPPSVHAYALG